MTKLFMKAPEGFVSAEIEGHSYEKTKDGVIEVRNAGHVETLRRHGFTDHFEDPQDAIEKIDNTDDKDWLVQFIEERGGDADDSMSLKKLRRLAKESLEG